MTGTITFPAIKPKSADLVLPYYAYSESSFRDVVYRGITLGSKPGEAKLSLLFENSNDDSAALVDQCFFDTISGALPVTLPPEIAAGIVNNDFKKRILLENHLKWYFSERLRSSSVPGGAKLSTFSVELVANFDPSEIVDIVPPSPPSFALANDTGYSLFDGITRDGEILVSGLEPEGTWEYSVNSGTTWLQGAGSGFTLSPGSYAIGSVKVRQRDRSGNLSKEYSNQSVITVDVTPPFITEIRVDSSIGDQGGILNEGDQIRAIATLNESSVVTGPLTMNLVVGSALRQASYDPLTSTSTVLSFIYVIQEGDNDINGIAIPENSIQRTEFFYLPGTIANPAGDFTEAGNIASPLSDFIVAILDQLFVPVIDLAGNIAILTHQAVPDNPSFIVDTDVPPAPSIALAADTGASQTDWITNNGLVNVSGLLLGNAWQWSTNSGVSWSAGSGASFILPAGVYQVGSIRVRQINPAGTLSQHGQNSFAIVIDQTAPAPPSITPGPSTAGVTIYAEAGSIGVATFSRVGGGQVSRAFSGGGQTGVAVLLTLEEQFQIGEGLVAVSAYCTDTAGNQSQASTASFNLVYTGDPGFTYNDFSSTNGINLVDIIGVSNNFIVLTDTNGPSNPGTVGNVWITTARRYNRNWSTSWRMEISNPSPGLGADGFTIQWGTDPTLMGGFGGACGRVAGAGIIYALSARTWVFNDVVLFNSGSEIDWLPIPSALRQDLYYWLDYDFPASTLRFYISQTSAKPLTPTRQYNNIVFGSTPFHVGIGASTGGGVDNHILKSWYMSFP